MIASKSVINRLMEKRVFDSTNCRCWLSSEVNFRYGLSVQGLCTALFLSCRYKSTSRWHDQYSGGRCFKTNSNLFLDWFLAPVGLPSRIPPNHSIPRTRDVKGCCLKPCWRSVRASITQTFSIWWRIWSFVVLLDKDHHDFGVLPKCIRIIDNQAINTIVAKELVGMSWVTRDECRFLGFNWKRHVF